MFQFLKVLPQHFIPQHFLSSLIYRLTRIRCKYWKNFIIRRFITLFHVDMGSSIKKTTDDFEHFNDFFTRELLADARPVEEGNTMVSPVDGYLSQFGKIKSNSLIQAKRRYFTLTDLLAGNQESANKFIDGDFSTLYLSPKNYHRIHMPVNGRLIKMTYVPGRLFAVNQHTAHVVNNLFGRNERVIIDFETDIGSLCLIMVGAIFVGSMDTVWHQQITPARKRDIQQWNYDDQLAENQFNKGDEIGRFNMGSTVILLFQKDKVQWNEILTHDQEIIMGQPLANNKD